MCWEDSVVILFHRICRRRPPPIARYSALALSDSTGWLLSSAFSPSYSTIVTLSSWTPPASFHSTVTVIPPNRTPLTFT
nr:hypothetical protein CFP56_07385 [Quercus suber]